MPGEASLQLLLQLLQLGLLPPWSLILQLLLEVASFSWAGKAGRASLISPLPSHHRYLLHLHPQIRPNEFLTLEGKWMWGRD